MTGVVLLGRETASEATPAVRLVRHAHRFFFDRTAKFIILIGEKDCWGKGNGTEATRLTLDHGFTVLDLHNWPTVNSHNERGIRAYTRAGFRELGTVKE